MIQKTKKTRENGSVRIAQIPASDVTVYQRRSSSPPCTASNVCVHDMWLWVGARYHGWIFPPDTKDRYFPQTLYCSQVYINTPGWGLNHQKSMAAAFARHHKQWHDTVLCDDSTEQSMQTLEQQSKPSVHIPMRVSLPTHSSLLLTYHTEQRWFRATFCPVRWFG